MKTRTIVVLAGFLGTAGWITGQGLESTTDSGVVYRAKAIDARPPDRATESKLKTRDGDLIHVTTRINSVATHVGSNRLKLVEQSSLVIEEGTWASFETVTELTYPSEYDPPSVPESLGEGISYVDETDEKPLKKNPVGALIPALPSDFEKRDLGLIVKLRPRVGKGGAIEVDYELKRALLNGFVNYGAPITAERQKRPEGKARQFELMRNRILMPVFQAQNESFTISPSASHWLDGLDVPKQEDGTPLEFGSLAANFTEPNLPGLSIQFEAKKIETGLKPAARAPESRRQIFITSKFIETPKQLNPRGLEMRTPLLSDAEFQVLIRAMNQEKDVDLLSAPSVLTRNGQTRIVEVAKELIYPVSYSPPELAPSAPPKAAGEEAEEKGAYSFPLTPSAPKEFQTRRTGIQLGVTAHILDDGSIAIEAEPKFVEKQALLNFGAPIFQPHFGLLGKYQPIVLTENALEMPVFERRTMKTRARIPDGHTILIGGFETDHMQVREDKVPLLGDLPIIGKVARSEVEVRTRRYVYLALTARLVDPAGLPVARR